MGYVKKGVSREVGINPIWSPNGRGQPRAPHNQPTGQNKQQKTCKNLFNLLHFLAKKLAKRRNILYLCIVLAQSKKLVDYEKSLCIFC